MFDRITWLQFFADGGGASGGAAGGRGGGDGAATGVQAADAGQDSLEALGVPRDRAERFRARKAARNVNEATESADVPESAPPAPQETAPAMGWDDFMAIPENKQRLQQMMSERGKKANEAKLQADAEIGKIAPMLELVASRYGIEAKDGKYDLDRITQAVMDDDSYYERRAEDLGVDVSVAKQLEQSNMERRRAEAQAQALREQQQKQEREFQLQQHFLGMQQQANKLKQLFPDFDLSRELQNPVFLQRTSPEGGMSVEDAFYSIHHGEILQQQAEAVARRARADVASSIRSGSRPRENGGASTAAASASPDLKTMTREQRRAYIKNKYAPTSN